MMYYYIMHETLLGYLPDLTDRLRLLECQGPLTGEELGREMGLYPRGV
jgi:hypothetical protein